MLSYRHAFHAGNHADVLKHLVLIQLTRYLGQKDKPFSYIDTHAGAGAYALDSGYAVKLAEYKEGIGRLWTRNDLPPAVADYVDLVRKMNPDSRLQAYPGSPFFALWTMREQDRLRLFELRSKDARLLQANFQEAGRKVVVDGSDGFAGLKALLPPPAGPSLTPTSSRKPGHEGGAVPSSWTQPLFAPGTAPFTRIRLSSSSIATTSRFCTVTRSSPK